MIRPGEKIFVDTGAWIALVETHDSFHKKARADLELLLRSSARPVTSIPIILETFTFLERKSSRDLAFQWKKGLDNIDRLEILECSRSDLTNAWAFLERKEFHKLTLIDATSFVLMNKNKIRIAFAYDIHFSIAGFRYIS